MLPFCGYDELLCLGRICKLYHVQARSLSLSTYEANSLLDSFIQEWAFAPGAVSVISSAARSRRWLQRPTTSKLDPHLRNKGLICAEPSKLEK